MPKGRQPAVTLPCAQSTGAFRSITDATRLASSPEPYPACGRGRAANRTPPGGGVFPAPGARARYRHHGGYLMSYTTVDSDATAATPCAPMTCTWCVPARPASMCTRMHITLPNYVPPRLFRPVCGGSGSTTAASLTHCLHCITNSAISLGCGSFRSTITVNRGNELRDTLEGATRRLAVHNLRCRFVRIIIRPARRRIRHEVVFAASVLSVCIYFSCSNL